MMTKILLISSMFLGLLLLCQASSADKNIGIYELRKGNFRLKLTNYGATIISLMVPDKHGNVADVVLGYDDIESYKNDTVYFGCVVGRVANRIGGAQFTLDGKTYKLPANDGKNTLHGGTKGYGDVIWTVKTHKEDSHITFTYDSADNEQGFPGKLSVSVTYMIIDNNKLGVKMVAKPIDKATPVNLAQHSYWNLGGHNSGDILSHTIQIYGKGVTPTDKELIPTGEILSVKGTPYDLLEPRAIGAQINENFEGYDINYVLNFNSGNHLSKVATLKDPNSGRKMELWSNQRGVQFYSGTMLKDSEGKGGAIYKQYAGLALETQGFPNSVNIDHFPSQIVRPGETYKHYMVYRFTAS
ncbi:hypothetical protein L6164_000977 [Bauhinia variegata]|uniref:Uncharacterized protein n=1 Tax=Bauhinia variegata TaxID=167791 RepID=A0ACB9Q7H9_BAUVA|nr:hypothetical protein L6164_000977 [Bauhinia variegata]